MGQPGTRRSGSFAKAVGSFVPQLTKKAFQKYGFSTATLLTDWAAIVGPELAAFSRPERLKWPRNVDAYGDIDQQDSGRPGATLVLRVDGAQALTVQYQSRQIMDRINAYFGYCAVNEIRIMQAPVNVSLSNTFQGSDAGKVLKQRRQAVRTGPQPEIAGQDQLNAALARLGASIAAGR